MKGCFFLQRRFAYVGHELVKILKERYGVSEFCGYVQLRPSLDFLKSQKDIVYTKLLLAEDVFNKYKNEKLDLEYLDSLEKKYGFPNLWPYVSLDRILRYNLFIRSYPSDKSEYTHEEMMRVIQVAAKEIDKFLDEEKPDFIFSPVLNDSISLLFYKMAKARGIKTLLIYNPRLDERYAITEDYFNYKWLEDAKSDIEKNPETNQEYIKFARNYIKNFRAAPKYYLEGSKAAGYYKKFDNLLPPSIAQSIKWAIKSHYNYFRNPFKNDFNQAKPWYEFIDKIKRKKRILAGYSDLYDKENLEEDFAYFPLQCEPEGLHMLLAPFYTDQIWTAKQFAASLPMHHKLYVKDHPRMVGLRPRSYYEEIKKIPNVKFIDPAASSLELIAHSKLVAVAATGTAGFEAMLLQKPVIILSDAFYSKLPMVFRCYSVEDLPKVIWKALYDFNYSEQDLINFLAAMYKESAKLDLTDIWNIKGGSDIVARREELIPFVDLLAGKLGLYRKTV